MKDNQLLLHLIEEGESEKLEFKSELNNEFIGEVLASFLNTNGGRLIVGVNDNGDIKGILNADKQAQLLKKYLINSIIPDSPIDVDVVRVRGKELILCNVQEGTKQPYIYNSTIYYRTGASTHKATAAEVSALISQRQQDELHWERQINLRLEWDDLDEKLITKTLNEAKRNNRSSYDSSDIEEFLTEYGLMSNMSLTNACGLLFSNNTSKFYPQSRVRLTEYPESKTSDKLIRDEYLEGNLFSLVGQLQDFVEGLGTRSLFVENDWQRLDYSFPPYALREGFLNALIHRNYSAFNSHMTISIFPDRLVIANSGSLPEELGGVGSLKKEHRSFPNNPDIAHLFFLRGYIEKLGSGTNKILVQCREEGLIAPKWNNTKSEVVLTFFGPDPNNDALKPKYDALNSPQYDALKSEIDALNIKTSAKAMSRYVDILSYLHSYDSVPLKDITSSLSASRATVQRYLLSLIEHQLIEPIGPDKTRKYALNDALRAKLDALK